MKRRNYYLLFAVLLLSLTSLSPAQDFVIPKDSKERDKPTSLPQLPSAQKVTGDQPIRVSVRLEDSEYKELLNISDTYERETGNEVEIINRPSGDTYQEFTSQFDLGDGPDVMLVDGDWVIPLATGGYLLPIDSYQGNPAEGDVIETLLKTVQWNGYRWGTPVDMDPYVLTWQSQWLQTLGINEPPLDRKAWRDLIGKLVNLKDGEKLLAMDPKEPYAFAALAGAMGLDLLHPQIEELDWFVKAHPYMSLTGAESANDLWIQLDQGKLAFLITSASKAITNHKPGYQTQMPEELYVKNPQLLRSHSYAVSSQSAHPEKAADWISYMSSQGVEQSWFRSTGKLPALQNNYDEALLSSDEIPFHLDELLKIGSLNKADHALQQKWELIAAQAELLLAGTISAQEYKENIEAPPKEKPAD